LLPIGTICLALVISGILCGIYGIAIAALGMLSFVGTTGSIDAFGPIADNAGGIAESCHLGEDIRVITDKLDAVGNTTAAICKGFAIGSAAFATVSLIFSYVGSYSSGMPDLNIAGYIVIAGAIFGAAIIEFFIAMLSDNTIDAAYKMADEGDRQLSIPGVLEGTVKPDYEKVISMAANLALKKMIAPSLVALIVPVVGGFLFGVEFVGGLLVGATIVAIPRAIFMGNSGGAFDNAKKFIESGMLEGHGKGSAAHKAAVAGDTIGDTRKDVVGVALDIAIKLMSTVAVTLVPLFLAFHLF
jgi:K(+)-stimulated pyrophosphate-energized sodium pump